MTTPDGGTRNTAKDDATVGAQIGAVHGDFYNFVTPPDAGPEKKFEIGVNCLESGIVSRARTYITAAIMEEYLTGETIFYWILALVSGRMREELPDEEASSLWEVCEKNRSRITGEWREAVNTVLHILGAAERAEVSETEIEVTLKELDRLDLHKRRLIVRHTEDFLRGPIRDGVWQRVVRSARAEQRDHGREDHVWKFFEPEPAGPRVRPEYRADMPRSTWVEAVLGIAALAWAIVYSGYLLAQAGRVPLLFVALLSLAGGVIGTYDCLEWRFRVARCRAKDQVHEARRRPKKSGRREGFAPRVTDLFDRYFARFVPRGTDKAVWLARTEGVRQSLRDEVVEIYREQRIEADAVAWLIRHLARKVRHEYLNHTLHAYQTDLATRVTTKFTGLFGVATLGLGGTLTLAGAIAESPLRASYAIFFLLSGGWAAVHAASDIIIKRRMARQDNQERDQEYTERCDAYARWKETLSGRPTDRQMSAWLECDQNLLLEEALRHYNLTISRVLTYTFLEAPASDTRGRARGGPWRYARYRMHLFILTKDGVRMLSAFLDMHHGTFHDRRWTSYRYDAVTMLEMEQEDNERRAFELFLTSGQSIEITIIPNTHETTDEAAMVTLEAAGILHTLRILEGISAEGKEWITRTYRRDRRPPNPAA